MNTCALFRKGREELGEKASDFQFLLHALNRGHFYHIQKISKEIGLSKGQPMVLQFLYCSREVTQKELSDFLQIKPASLTEILQRMEKNDLVCRKRGEKDQRTMWVSITKKGTEKFEEYSKREADLDRLFFQNFLPEEKEAFLSSLEKMIENLMLEMDCWEVEK